MVDLIGFAHTPFGRLPGADVETLMAQVAGEAIAEAGLEASDIDSVVIGHFGHGLVRQGFTAGLSAGLLPGLRMTPALRVENALCDRQCGDPPGCARDPCRRCAPGAGDRRRGDVRPADA